MSNKHLSVEFLYLYADPVFGQENWSHEIIKKKSNYRRLMFLKCIVLSF